MVTLSAPGLPQSPPNCNVTLPRRSAFSPWSERSQSPDSDNAGQSKSSHHALSRAGTAPGGGRELNELAAELLRRSISLARQGSLTASDSEDTHSGGRAAASATELRDAGADFGVADIRYRASSSMDRQDSVGSTSMSIPSTPDAQACSEAASTFFLDKPKQRQGRKKRTCSVSVMVLERSLLPASSLLT